MTALFSQLQTLSKVEVFKIVTGIGLLFGCAQINIPLQPVPITLHTIAVLLIGLTYTPREALQTIGSYLILGALGLPVFAAYHGGFICLFGKTGGYLFGFLVAAVSMAILQKSLNTHKIVPTILLCLVGHGIIYTMGVAWLATFIGLNAAITYGLMPFILPEMVKAVLLSGAIYGVRYKQRRG